MKTTLIVMMWLLGLGALAGGCNRLHAEPLEAANRSAQPNATPVADHNTPAGRARHRGVSFGTEENS